MKNGRPAFCSMNRSARPVIRIGHAAVEGDRLVVLEEIDKTRVLLVDSESI